MIKALCSLRAWLLWPIVCLLPVLAWGNGEPLSVTFAAGWPLNTDNLPIMATGMMLALVFYNFCILVRAPKRSYLEYCLYGLLMALFLYSWEYDNDTSMSLSVLGWPLPNYLFLFCAMTAAIQFQMTLLPIRQTSHAVWLAFNASKWLTAVLTLLAAFNFSTLGAIFEQWSTSLVILLATIGAICSFNILSRGHLSAALFLSGWLALSFGLLGSLIYRNDVTSLNLFGESWLELSIHFGIVVQAVANSLALPAFTTQRYRMYQEGYELMENNLQRQHNQRRVYNNAVRQYLRNIPSMSEQSVATQLLEVLNNLIPIETSMVLIFREGQIKVVGLTFSKQIYFQRMLENRRTLLENIARHGQISTLPPLPGYDGSRHLNVIPVYYDKSSWVLVIMQPLEGKNLEVDHLQLSMDISNHACSLFMASNSYRKLQNEADTDSLTGILNRRAFLRNARTTIRRLQEHNYGLSLLYLDIDLFKSLNDNYGHAFGDHVLKQFAEVCQDNLRERDLLGRIGGEEFSVLLPQADINTAINIAERIRTSIARLNFTELKGGCVTVSIGVAGSEICGFELRHLMAKADSALYRAKTEGRNRTATVTDVVIGP
ncbi:diguanylate cyclase [Sansalvadorimonas verongulae]|uniref:diguanylate cyclase n=1 Tax=Sansalvadorimonas verongulae TaxID=2172824 RepID=UPI0012BCD698|nr:diguanylate cyclase [Sansalvadorimonas verongulae]MTI15195.1 diguanylate cyclase [Sansalvadorimonas verongulae]